VHNIELAIKRIAGEVRMAVERLYEAIVEAVARLLKWLREHWRVLALLAAVRVDKRTAREEFRKAVEKVRELAEQAARHSTLFGEWKPPECAREAGRDMAIKAVSYARHKGLGEGAEREFVKLSAFKGPRGREAAEDEVVTFDALGGRGSCKGHWRGCLGNTAHCGGGQGCREAGGGRCL